ncbi:MAG: hypothetical protein IPK82_07065 [Polyangiaceae bacterium]|nr:hypothetical protein [Polyangiaceae bacterium]
MGVQTVATALKRPAMDLYSRATRGDTGDRDLECKPLPESCGNSPACGCLPQPHESTCSEVHGNGVTGLTVTEFYQ